MQPAVRRLGQGTCRVGQVLYRRGRKELCQSQTDRRFRLQEQGCVGPAAESWQRERRRAEVRSGKKRAT